MLRRLENDQSAPSAYTELNLAWAKGQVSKLPEGRQASANSGTMDIVFGEVDR